MHDSTAQDGYRARRWRWPARYRRPKDERGSSPRACQRARPRRRRARAPPRALGRPDAPGVPLQIHCRFQKQRHQTGGPELLGNSDIKWAYDTRRAVRSENIMRSDNATGIKWVEGSAWRECDRARACAWAERPRLRRRNASRSSAVDLTVAEA